MKTHSTNYYKTLITPARDCSAQQGIVPPEKVDKKTIANYQFEWISQHPLQYTSDDIIFEIYALKQDLLPTEKEAARQQFFSKGQPCLRTSPLTKTYGWGIYADEDGKIKLIDSASTEFQEMLSDEQIKKVSAMKSKK
ncbi:DUF6157 family protein [Sphingobacterium wenxiniae]|uniref:Uncharacterized protein n=1 Tax=Sphingobacterium wenxiniae TaxID=683125 RepID=A0A1I6Q471_9SPHI|nr:DUF6157 family protein [Sphingobacterium wenxiniae]SFS47247.1 hypothetical protein SAMN05660206_102110 [Sphingobacterium wenxiniae]